MLIQLYTKKKWLKFRIEQSSTRGILNFRVKGIKTESTRKLSNFNFPRTKTLYQNNLKNIAFLFTFLKGLKSFVVTPKKISHGSLRKWMSHVTSIVITQVKFWNFLCKIRSPSNGASISYTSPWSQPFPE